MNEGDGGALGWGDGPTASLKVDLVIGIDPAAQMERQMQVQQGGGRARPYRRAILLECRAGGDQMGHAQGGEGALEFRTGIAIIGHGIMPEKAEAIGIDDQRQVVRQKEAAEMFEMIPGRIGGNKDRAQKFSRMIIDGQEQGLLGVGWPPLVDGGIVLPEFAQTGAFPAAAGFGARFGLADEVGEMGSDKGGDRLPMALETEAAGQFIGRELKVGRFLQRDKLFEELAGLGRPIRPVAAAGEMGAELRSVLEPAGAQSIKVRAADLEMERSLRAVDLAVVKLLKDVLEKGVGQAFSQLFFSPLRMNPNRALVEGLRRLPLRSSLLSPSTRGRFP